LPKLAKLGWLNFQVLRRTQSSYKMSTLIPKWAPIKVVTALARPVLKVDWRRLLNILFEMMERETGFEPATSSLGNWANI